MADLEFIDSSGLSVLVAGLKRLRDSGGDLTLRSVPDQTRRVLEVSGLSRVLSIA
jgi:anti-anti-sigma factor